MGDEMSLLDLLDQIPRFISRYLFPVYVECADGELVEVAKVDFRNGCAGTVLVCEKPLSSDADWDDELYRLRSKISEAWAVCEDIERPDAAVVFDPLGNVISIETAYRLLEETQDLLNRMYE